jgi:hypothetical protein
MGKINTNTLLLIGAGVVGVYLLTRPKVPVYNPYQTGLPAYNPYQTGLPAAQYPGNTTAQDINAGASALSSLSDLIGNFF